MARARTQKVGTALMVASSLEVVTGLLEDDDFGRIRLSPYVRRRLAETAEYLAHANTRLPPNVDAILARRR